MKRSTERDYYYNTPEVFMPKSYRAECPENRDFLHYESPYILLHPRVLKKEHRSRQFQLARIMAVYCDDDDFVDEVLVMLACNGNKVLLYTFDIMAFAHEEDVELWKELYGEMMFYNPEASSQVYGLHSVDDAIEGVDYQQAFIKSVEEKIRKKYQLPEDAVVTWLDDGDE